MNVQQRGLRLPLRDSIWTDFIRKDDWLAVWIGLALIVAALASFASGGFIKRLGVVPLEIDSSHSPFLSMPRATAQLLVAATRSRPVGPLLPN